MMLIVLSGSIEKYKKGIGIQGISSTSLANILIPLPPLAEQQRIVARIEELLPLIEAYDKKYTALENLNATFPDKLKKSILQAAVQGKLVSQDPNDEPASVLLEHIRAEREQLVRDGKIKRNKDECVIFRRDNSHSTKEGIFYERIGGIEYCIDDEIPFDIPDNWEWVRLGNILNKITDGTHSTPRYVEQGVPFLSVKDISDGRINFSNTKYISLEEHTELYKRCNPEFGDILLTKVGTTGIPVLIETENPFSLFVSVALLKFNPKYIMGEYLVELLKSPLVQDQCNENTRGVGNKNWVIRDIFNTLIVLPPLVEQHRIVIAIKNFMDKIVNLNF